MLELMRDQGRPPDVSNMDIILAMFPKCRKEVEVMLVLGTFVELVDREAVLKQKELLLNTVIVVLETKTSSTTSPSSSHLMLTSFLTLYLAGGGGWCGSGLSQETELWKITLICDTIFIHLTY